MLRCSVSCHIQAPICLVWVIFLAYLAVSLYCNHLYIYYSAALLFLCLTGGGLLLVLSTMLSLSNSRVLCHTDVGSWHHLMYLVIFSSCCLPSWLVLLSFCLFCLLFDIFLVHSFVCVGLKWPIAYKCTGRVRLPGNWLVWVWVD